jgi:choline-glycine betaine transporter
MIVFWGVATGAVAAIMLVSGGDHALEGIQNLTFLASVPFALIMVLMCVSRGKDLRTDGLIERRRRADDLLAKLVESEDREDQPPEQDPPDRQ